MLFCGIGIEHIQRPSIELAKAAAVRYLRLNPALMAALLPWLCREGKVRVTHGYDKPCREYASCMYKSTVSLYRNGRPF